MNLIKPAAPYLRRLERSDHVALVAPRWFVNIRVALGPVPEVILGVAD